MMDRDLAYYRRQPYQRLWETREEVGERYFIVRIAEFPRIAGDGSSRSEALLRLREAFDDFVEWRLEDGLEIPDPFRGQVGDDREPVEIEWVEGDLSHAVARDNVACYDLNASATEQTCPASAAESLQRVAERVDVGALSSAA
jgi:predicted RNase H-like HicB family nuclease